VFSDALQCKKISFCLNRLSTALNFYILLIAGSIMNFINVVFTFWMLAPPKLFSLFLFMKEYLQGVDFIPAFLTFNKIACFLRKKFCQNKRVCAQARLTKVMVCGCVH